MHFVYFLLGVVCEDLKGVPLEEKSLIYETAFGKAISKENGATFAEQGRKCERNKCGKRAVRCCQVDAAE